MASDAASKVKAYKDTLIAKAEHLIIHGFPEKIVELNELLATPMFRDRNLRKVHQDLNIPVPDPVVVNNLSEDETDDAEPQAKRARTDYVVPGTKVMCLTSGSVPCNSPLCEMIEVVKPIILKMDEDCNLLKMWMLYLVPKIEDGNNFGVSVQEDKLGDVCNAESEQSHYLRRFSNYFLSRAKIVSKVAKYPHVDDYRRAVIELDEREYLNLYHIVNAVRNRYSSLHDAIIKNLAKIKEPRSSNAESLY